MAISLPSRLLFSVLFLVSILDFNEASCLRSIQDAVIIDPNGGIIIVISVVEIIIIILLLR